MELKTPAMTKGYINRPDATEKLFTPDGWVNTGDIIPPRTTTGFCFFVRRADDMFVCGGENVFPAAVESVLESHPAVEQACVVAVPDELKGAKPVAYVVTRTSKNVTENELKQYFFAHAPAYMHPRRIFLVDRLPLSPTNKIDPARCCRSVHWRAWRERTSEPRPCRYCRARFGAGLCDLLEARFQAHRPSASIPASRRPTARYNRSAPAIIVRCSARVTWSSSASSIPTSQARSRPS